MSEKKQNLFIDDNLNDFNFEKNESNLNISYNRVTFIFFLFLIIALIFSLKAIYLGSLEKDINKKFIVKSDNRSTILDSEGNIVAKSVIIKNIGINPNLVIDKKRLLINLKLLFPNKNYKEIKKKLDGNKFFYFQKKITQEKYDKLLLLGDKSIITEQKISRIYPHENLFSHIIGQIDEDNKGISGLEKSFDYELRTSEKSLELTLDTELQYLIREQLIYFTDIFKNIGSAAILMNVNNGNILSMVSLPDFNLNKREKIKDVNYINRATKGVYELGSVFKTFTIASGLNEGVIEPETEFLDLPKNITCAGRPIREYDNKISKDLTAEQILIRSGNIGAVRIAQKVGIQKFKSFLGNIGVLNKIEFDIDEVGLPIKFRWGKCRLATSSYGHGITTTPLQLAKGYSIIVNGGYEIIPTLIKKNSKKKEDNKRILKEGVTEKMNIILRKIVSTKEGTANFANIVGYQVGGKTGTAQKSINGIYTKNKINTFASIFPTTKPKYVLIVLLDEPKINKEYVYHYIDGSGWKQTGTPYYTAGWTSVEIVGKIIEKLGPILATKY